MQAHVMHGRTWGLVALGTIVLAFRARINRFFRFPIQYSPFFKKNYLKWQKMSQLPQYSSKNLQPLGSHDQPDLTLHLLFQ